MLRCWCEELSPPMLAEAFLLPPLGLLEELFIMRSCMDDWGAFYWFVCTW